MPSQSNELRPKRKGPCRVAVLFSGRGSNLQSLIEDQARDDCPYQIVGAACNRPQAPGIARAEAVGLPIAVIDHKQFADRETFERQLIEAIKPYRADLIALAGFMRVLSPFFIHRFNGRILNIHPSRLPLYPNLHTHRQALADSAQVHGASVHFVDEGLDSGPVVIQSKVPVLPEDDEKTLSSRVLKTEHNIFPQALRWFAERRLALSGDIAWLDGAPLPVGGIQYE